jgi:metallo-beta-lactamase family protein
MELEFVGAAQTVTGSMHLLRTEQATILLDCGLFQGRRRESHERNSKFSIDTSEIDAVVLSHAHIDHSGALPLLEKNGYTGPIFATPATRDLCTVMLRDAAAIQEQDARFLNKEADRTGSHDHVDPLYTDDDVVNVVGRMVSLPYKQRLTIADGVRLTFLDAGHVLGSAITVLDVTERGQHRRLAFTGDLGRYDRPILNDPEVPTDVDLLITESTYGDRLHDGTEKMEEDLAAVVRRTYERGGKVLIPSFALERAQEVVFALKKLRKAGLVPRMPVYVDSPLTVKITDIFKLHPECYDAETRGLMRGDDSPFEFEDLVYVEDREASKAISSSSDPAIVISASGMCEAGRILHHLRAGVENENNTILIVGYQAQHTLGRRFVEQRSRVRIFGVERDRRADVVVLNGFSAHADQKDLVGYAEACRKRGRVAQVALVHGDPKPQQILSSLIHEALPGVQVATPGPFDKLTVK